MGRAVWEKIVGVVTLYKKGALIAFTVTGGLKSFSIRRAFTPAFLSRVLLPRGIFQDTFAGTFASWSPGFFEIPLEVESLLLPAS